MLTNSSPSLDIDIKNGSSLEHPFFSFFFRKIGVLTCVAHGLCFNMSVPTCALAVVGCRCGVHGGVILALCCLKNVKKASILFPR